MREEQRSVRVYLCSRVSLDAREMNEQVAVALERAGYLVWVPHRQRHNNEVGSSDKEIYEQDMSAMKQCDAVVIVGKVGVDCGVEIGHFMAREIPAFWYLPPPPPTRHPMAHPILSQRSYNNVYSLVSALDQQFGVQKVKGKLTLLTTLMRFSP